jgi:hypothetical protein
MEMVFQTKGKTNMTKEDLLALLRLCNADSTAIDAVELAYEMGYKAGQNATPTTEDKETND